MGIRYFSEWTKYSCYTLQQHKEKGTHVTCAHASELVTYDPFCCADDILLETLAIGKDTGSAKLELRVLDFCNRYGLLGFGQAVIEKEYENSTAKLYVDNVFGEKLISNQQLMGFIFPFDKYSHRVKKREQMPITMRWEVDCELRGCEWPIFDARYAERVEWIAYYARCLYDTLLRFHRKQPLDFPLGNVKCRLNYDGTAKIIWQYDSLKSAIDIMFVGLLQQSLPTIRLCKRCLSPFEVATGTRALYCSVSCRNVENVARSRQRKKAAD